MNNQYSIHKINQDTIDLILDSPFVNEYVHGLEIYKLNREEGIQLFTPSMYKQHDLPEIENNPLPIYDCTVYTLKQKKHSMFPIDIKTNLSIIDKIINSDIEDVFIQILFKKTNSSWNKSAITRYEEYLRGNDDPFDNKFLRTFQNKLSSLINQETVIRERSLEIEDKIRIINPTYYTEVRITLFHSNLSNYIGNEISNWLTRVRLFNEIEIVEHDSLDIKNHIINQTLSDEVETVFSRDEILTLFSSDKHIISTSTLSSENMTNSIEENISSNDKLKVLPSKEIIEREVDQSIVDKINQALVRVGATPKPSRTFSAYQSMSLIKVQFYMPKNINYTKIQNKLKDLQGALGKKNISIDIGDEPDTFKILYPLDNRETVYLRNIMESESFTKFKEENKLPFVIGQDTDGEFIYACLSNLRHLLIAGTTGSGKSVFFNSILVSLLLSVPSDELSMYLIDPKMIELGQFEGFPQVKDVITDAKKACELLSRLCVEMDNRYKLFSQHKGCKDLHIYNQKSDTKMPYIVCGIDEFADLIMTDKEVENYVVRLGQKARAAGIHLIIATQRPDADVITGLMKANLPSRIAFSVASSVDSRIILDKSGAEDLMGKGDGLAKLEGYSKEFIRFQAPVITIDSKEEEATYDKMKELFANDSPVQYQLPKEESPIDKLKQIMIDTGERRVTELAKLMSMGSNSTHSLIKQLVDDGWLVKQGRGYEISELVDEEKAQV